jgi:predicted metal-dependent phosphotriesterase family hydrolase
MPTYSSALNVGLFGFSHPALPYPFPRRAEGIHLLDSKGHLRWEAVEICELIAGFDACLASGHVSAEEALALVKTAREIGVRRISITHASLQFLGLTAELQKELARFGAIIEHSFVGCTALNPHPLSMADIAAQVLTVGPEHCTLSTDLGQVLNPPPVEGFSTFAEGLVREGVSTNQIRRMVVENPRMLLGV